MPPASRHDLFSVDPNEFVAARNALVRQLDASGDNDEAAKVKQLRRPTLPIWALNQVSRRDAGAVDGLLDAERNAAVAQQAVLDGADAATLRDALSGRRVAMAKVARVARDALDESGRSGDTYGRDVEDALNVIVASARLRDELARGELTSLDVGDDDAGELLETFTVPDHASRTQREPSHRLVAARETLARRQADAATAAELTRESAANVARAEKALAAARRAHDAALRRQAESEQLVQRSMRDVERLE